MVFPRSAGESSTFPEHPQAVESATIDRPHRIPRTWPFLLSVVALVLFANGTIPFLAHAAFHDSVARPIFYSIFLWSGIRVIAGMDAKIRVSLARFIVFSLVSLAGVSIAWSVMPGRTLQQFIVLLGTSLFAFYIATSFGRRQQFQIFFVATFLLMVLSLIAVMAMPSYGIADDGTWQGIFIHKNRLGRIAAIGALLSLLGAVHGGVNRVLAFISLLMSTFLLLMSASATALVVFVVIVLLLPVLQLFRAHGSVAFPIFLLLLLAGSYLSLLVWTSPEVVLTALGRDPTLTGRTEVWAAVWGLIQEQPLLGYGYGSLWQDWSGPTAEIWRTVGFRAAHAHMGYLDLWLQVGIAGPVLLFILLSLGVVYALRSVRLHPNVVSYWHILYVVFYAVYNLNESVVFTQSFDWVMFLVVVLALDQSPIQKRLSP